MNLLCHSTPASWVPHALRDPGALLLDQLQCEMKAATTALSLLAKNPQAACLVAPLLQVAREELDHYARIHQLLLARGLVPEPVTPSPYMSEMRRRAAVGPHEPLLDRLLLSALVETRSCERFRLLSVAAGEPGLRALFAELVGSEAGHAALYVRLAKDLFRDKEVERRLAVLSGIESAILGELAPGAALHSGWRDLAVPAAATAT
jgi:tRNA-(ms[2]io[6]A)-hydroxylase